jgi:hypothetical protein
MTTTRGVHSPARDELDRYYTPPDLALAVLGALDERPAGIVVEPSIGAGSWVAAARRLTVSGVRAIGVDVDASATGLRLCDEAIVGDWMEVAPRLTEAADWVVGNPPYRHLDAHVRQSLEVGVRVVVLVRLGWLAGRARSDLFRRHPPRQVLIVTPRPSFVPGGGTDSADYCAVYWSRADVDQKMVRAQSTKTTWLTWRPAGRPRSEVRGG